MRIGLWLENIWSDFRQTSRKLRRDPLFTIVAVLTLALGVGANGAVFSVMYGLLLRHLPVPNAEQLVSIELRLAGQNIHFSGPMFEELQRFPNAIRETFAWAPFETYLEEKDNSQPIDGALISGSGFGVLRLRPELGRLLSTADDIPGGGPAGFSAVISDRFWKSHFGEKPEVLNRRLTINGTPVTIVGVMPAKFSGVLAGSFPDVVMPLEFEVQSSGAVSQLHFAGSTWLTVLGRRNADVPFNAAAARLQSFAPAILREGLATLPGAAQKELLPQLRLQMSPAPNGGSEKAGFRGGSLRDLYKKPILAVQGLAVFLLLLCLVNLTALQFARNTAREHEFAIRASLGAGSSRIWMQILIESLMTGTVGAAAALFVGDALDSALTRFLSNQQQSWLPDVRTDSTVALTILAVGIGCMVVSSIAPAIFATRNGLADHLRANRSRISMAGARRGMGGRFMVPLQVSVCMVLLVTGGIFLSTLWRLMTVPLGFDPQGVVLFPFNAPQGPNTAAREKAIEMRVLERLRTSNGVSAAALADFPAIGGGLPTTAIQSSAPAARLDRESPIQLAGPGYLAAMHTRLMAGRDFASTDTPNSPPVCLLSLSAAHYFFRGLSPLGRRLLMPPPRVPSVPAECEIVGVTEDTKYNDLRAEYPRLVYLNNAQASFPADYIAVRTTNVGETVREFSGIIRRESPQTRLSSPKILVAQIRSSIGRERLLGAVSGLFAMLALLVTGVGLYGFLTWSVVRRTSEIGIRMALGAEARTVVWMIGGETLLLIGIGVAFGTVASYFATKLAASMLYATTPSDPWVFCAAVTVLLLLGLPAAWIPARRAALLDPSSALRGE